MSAPLSTSVPYRVRFDESTPGGTLRASTLMRYAQDAAWIHSERLGFDRAWYARRGLTWVVRCAEVDVVDLPIMGETVEVTTTVVGYRKVWARRRTDVVRGDGSRAAMMLTDWVTTGNRGLPTRVPPELVTLFGDAVGSFTPARVALPAQPEDAVMRRFQVRPQELDPLAHANNAVYLDWLHEAAEMVPGGQAVVDRSPRRYRLEYLSAAASGGDVIGRIWRADDGLAYRLTSAEGAELLRATVGPRPAQSAS